MTSVKGIHYGGKPTPFNGGLLPQVTFDGTDKGAAVSAHKFRVTSANSRAFLIAADCNNLCCDCGYDIAPEPALARYLVENGGWPKNDDGTYQALPVAGLVGGEGETLEKLFYQIVAPKDGIIFDIVLGNSPQVVTDDCTGEEVECKANFAGDEELVLLAGVDASIGGCNGCRDGQGYVDLAAAGIVAPDNFLKWNDWIGIKPTTVPEPEEGQTEACVWENFGLMISPVQCHPCKGS